MALCPTYLLPCCPPNLAKIAPTLFVVSALANEQFPEGADHNEENLISLLPTYVHGFHRSPGNK